MLFVNLYMYCFLKYWCKRGRGIAYRAHIVAYVDDFVILSCGHAVEALVWTRQVMAWLGLALNEAKISVRDARRERFDFLGYTFGPHRYRKDGHWYLGASPSKKSVLRLTGKVRDLLVPGNMGVWYEVRDRLNSLIGGWAAYFSYGTRLMVYRAVDNHVYDRVRHFLVRRHKVQSRGTKRYPMEWCTATSACCSSAEFIGACVSLEVKPVESRMREIARRFDERGGKGEWREGNVPHPPNVAAQLGVPLGASRQLRGIGTPCHLLVVGRRGDRQQPADRLDPVRVAVIVDERDHGLDRRSSSAIAKYAEAFRRISFACRSSRTSRSRALIRSRPSVVGPARCP